MVRSSGHNRRVLLCVYPDVDLIKSCDPKESLLLSPDMDIDLDDDDCLDDCELAEEMSLDPASDYAELFDHEPIVLNDRMMTDAGGAQSPRIQSEHSYSLTLGDDIAPHSPYIKLEDYGKDMDSECFPVVSGMSSGSVQSEFSEDVLIKQEPPSPPPTGLPRISAITSLLSAPSPPLVCLEPKSLLKQPTIVLAARPSSHVLLPKVKLEPSVSNNGFSLPPTPPSCNGSDSEGSLSPVHGGSSASHHSSSSGLLSSSSSSSSGHSSRKSHAKAVLPISSKHSNSQTALISSQPKGATGILQLTDEEKRTLLAEGYHIPQKLPLTKAEERSLKKIRRKIKNKISAQESRRKKKEYMDALEKKVELLASENSEFKKELISLQGVNKSLLTQLQQFEVRPCSNSNKRLRSVSTQTVPSFASLLPPDFIKKEIFDDFDGMGSTGR